uniref:XLR/SYCP3/FAM9 domain-containing protein n=1 Tax=Mus spicilegus TaxID=10103 RepID=A0A8C6HQ18_MUSSI
MPPKGKKATSKSVKRPQDSSDTQSDDVIQRRVPRTPAEQPVVIEISDESTSSDQDDQQARESVQKTAKKRQGDATESHLAKKKQFCQDVVTSVKSLSEKLVSIYKRQKRERNMFHSNYSKSLQSLFQQWDMSVEKVGQEEDSFINSSHQHEKIIYNTMMAQKATIDQAKAISDQFLKNIQELEEKHKLLDALEQNRLENEMKNLKKKLVADNHQQDLAVLESCLHSMFS